MSGEAFRGDLPALRVIRGAQVLTKRDYDEDGAAILILFDGLAGVEGVMTVVSASGARQFAAELLNIADDIEGIT